jgi:hypothetical protein
VVLWCLYALISYLCSPYAGIPLEYVVTSYKTNLGVYAFISLEYNVAFSKTKNF